MATRLIGSDVGWITNWPAAWIELGPDHSRYIQGIHEISWILVQWQSHMERVDIDLHRGSIGKTYTRLFWYILESRQRLWCSIHRKSVWGERRTQFSVERVFLHFKLSKHSASWKIMINLDDSKRNTMIGFWNTSLYWELFLVNGQIIKLLQWVLKWQCVKQLTYWWPCPYLKSFNVTFRNPRALHGQTFPMPNWIIPLSHYLSYYARTMAYTSPSSGIYFYSPWKRKTDYCNLL